MSIFKTKLCWSNNSLRESKEADGFQNSYCLKIDKFSSHNDSDCIIVGEESNITIYKPNFGDFQSTDVVLEKQLDGFILYIETGKFLMNLDDRQIIILHSQSYAIYALNKKEGHNEAGEQNTLTKIITHKFSRQAYSLTTGHFNNIKNRQLVCIQALDGSLSFFDQDTFLFLCVFNDITMPGPVSYIGSCDCFVICKSNWILEIYSYQQLRDFSELSARQNKKQIPQWTYNAGEEISSVQVVQTSNIFSSIVALGERYLYCFQDNGLMKFMKKFDFMPICFHAYLVGWYYEPGARLLIMVASEDSKLFIYEDTTLLWSCDLLDTPIALSRCFLKNVPGGIVTLSDNGVVNVGYIGTEPDLSYGQANLNEPVSHEAVQKELETSEQTLLKILENKGDLEDKIKVDDLLNIEINIGKPAQDLFQQSDYYSDATLHLLMAPVIIKITFSNPKFIQTLQINYICHQPLYCSEATVFFDSVNGTEVIETNIFVSSELDIVKSSMEILFTITDENGKINVISKTVGVPISLFCTPNKESEMEYDVGIVLKTNTHDVDLTELFFEFEKGELLGNGDKSNISLYNRVTNSTTKIFTMDKEYHIKATDFKDIILILENLVNKLKNYIKNSGEEFEFHIKVNKELSNNLIHTFLKSIEGHAKARIALKKFEDQLNILQHQFTLIQKKLLVQYGSQPPGDCEALDLLMKDTYSRLQETARQIMQDRISVNRAGNNLIAVGNLIIYILRNEVTDKFKVKLIEETLSLNSLYDDYQEWEESVNQAIPYILNNIFTKTEKDKEKLASVSEQGILAHINLKKFLKQIRIILDQMFAEAFVIEGKEDDAKAPIQNTKIVRIEELVEVI